MLLNVFLDGGVDSLAVLAPVGDSTYHRLRPKLGLRDGRAFAEDGRLRWHPSVNALADLHAEGKVSVLPAVGYTGADQSHFTSRHFWEVGALDANLRTGWLGRVLDRVGAADNPLQGVSWTASSRPRSPPPATRSRRSPSRRSSASGRPARGGPAEELAVPAFTQIGRSLQGSSDPAIAQAARAAAFAGNVRDALAPLGKDGKPLYAPAAAYPQTADPFPKRLAGFAAMLAAGLPIRAASVRAPGTWDTHANQEEDDAEEPAAHVRLAARLPARHRGARARRPRARAGVVGVRAPRGRERLGHRPRRRRRRLPDRHARRGPDDRRVPGVDKLDADGNLRATSDFRGLYGALCGDWFGVDPAAVLPDARGIGKPVILK